MSSYLVSPDGQTFWKSQLKGKTSIITMGPRGDAGTFLVKSHASEAAAAAYVGELVRQKKEEEAFVDGARPGFTLGHSASVFDGAALAAEAEAEEARARAAAAAAVPAGGDKTGLLDTDLAADDACAGSDALPPADAASVAATRKRALENEADAEKQQHRSSPSNLAKASVSTAPTTTSPERAALTRKLADSAATRAERVRLQVKTKTRKTLEGISSPSDLMSPISRTLSLRKKPRTVLEPESMEDEPAGSESDSDAPVLTPTQEMDEGEDAAGAAEADEGKA